MMWMYLAFVFIGCAAAEKCTTVTLKPDLINTRMDGKWYKIKCIENDFGGRCVSLTYTTNKNGTADVKRKFTEIGSNKRISLEGHITQIDFEESKVKVDFKSRHVKSSYWILDTDYDTFGVIWHCENGKDNIWIMTRKSQPNRSVLEKAYAVLHKNGINPSILKNIDQEDCPKD